MILEIIQILVLFVLPVLLVYYKTIPFKYRIHTLAIVTLSTFAVILIEGWTLIDLGIRIDTLGKYFLPYIIFTLTLAMFLIVLARLLKRRGQENFFRRKRFIYIAVISSISQELMFRGYLFAKLYEMTSNYYIIILINALLFAFIHVIYSNTPLTLFMIFIAGICFASMYWAYPNLILLIISHTILNYIAVHYGFFYEGRKKIAGVGKISFEI
jgi:membrane protease YdiL (CAAX protease family)